jgi:hypothetical protein
MPRISSRGKERDLHRSVTPINAISLNLSIKIVEDALNKIKCEKRKRKEQEKVPWLSLPTRICSYQNKSKYHQREPNKGQ